MPRIATLGSIKIELYFHDHLPPHFHAIYGEDRILIEIETLATYAGSLPLRQLKEVIKWASQERVQQRLLQKFQEFSPRARNVEEP